VGKERFMKIDNPSLFEISHGECLIGVDGIQKLFVYTSVKNGVQEMEEYPLTNNTGLVLRCRTTGRGELLEREGYLAFTTAYFGVKPSKSSRYKNIPKVLDVVFIEPSDTCEIFYGNCKLVVETGSKVINNFITDIKHKFAPITDVQNGDTLIAMCTAIPGFVIYRDIILAEQIIIENQLVGGAKFPYYGKLLFPRDVEPAAWISQWSSRNGEFIALLLREFNGHETPMSN
jgi:hypothetical protein